MPELGIKRTDHRMTNNKVGSEWYECSRCGDNYPRAGVVIQLGIVVCLEKCYDLPGRDALSRGYPLRTEDDPPPLPVDNQDI